MAISGILSTSVQDVTGSTLSTRQGVAATSKAESVMSPESSTYDFTDMSRREVNQLVKSGVMDLPPLVLPEGGLDLTGDVKAQMDAVYDNKINFIDRFKKSIDFLQTHASTQESRNMLHYYQRSLNEMLALQGQTRSSGVDVSV